MHENCASRGAFAGREPGVEAFEFAEIEGEERRFATAVAGGVKRDALLVEERKRPNKSPEPTPTAVTPRATEMKTEAKKSRSESTEARVAPAVGVAHL